MELRQGFSRQCLDRDRHPCMFSVRRCAVTTISGIPSELRIGVGRGGRRRTPSPEEAPPKIEGDGVWTSGEFDFMLDPFGFLGRCVTASGPLPQSFWIVFPTLTAHNYDVHMSIFVFDMSIDALPYARPDAQSIPKKPGMPRAHPKLRVTDGRVGRTSPMRNRFRATSGRMNAFGWTS